MPAGIDWIAPRNSTKFRPMYRQTDVPASEKLTMSGLPSHCGIESCETPNRPITESSVPPGWKKNRKMNEIATPLIRYGKKRIPLKMFLNRVLKLSSVAKYSASASWTTDAAR